MLKIYKHYRILVVFALAVLMLFVTSKGEDVSETYQPSLKTLGRTKLKSEIQDFRYLVFNHMDQRLNKHGAVWLAKGFKLDQNLFEEHSTVSWKTIEDACKDMKLLERGFARPQIRVIKRNLIIQSSLDPYSSGLNSEFLRTPLESGDIIVLTVTND